MKKRFVIIFIIMAAESLSIQTRASQGLYARLEKDEVSVIGQIDQRVFYSSEDAARALQAAIDLLAEEGGELKIGPGRYYLDRPLTLHDNILLAGSGRSTRLMVNRKNSDGIGILCREVNGVTISDLTLSSGVNKDARNGIIIDNCGNVKIRDVFSVGFAEYGIWMRNSSFLCEITGCTLAGNGKANIYLSRLRYGTIGNFIPNLINHCTIYGGGKGIECNEVIVLNIIGCILYQTGGTGFHLHTGSNSVLINGCRTFQISSDAILVEDTHELNVSGNIFCWQTGHGIVVRNSAWGTISGNNIIDNGSYNPGGPIFDTKYSDLKEDIPLKNGIWLSAVRGYQVSANAVFNWSVVPPMNYGILEEPSCFKNIIQANNVNYFEKGAVRSEGTETVVSNNTGFGEDTYFEMLNLERTESSEPQFWQGSIQSFQPELLQEYIDNLK
jgi:parallel beta-helix repeat protein